MYQRSQRSHDKTIFQVILIISAVSVVNDEIIFNVALRTQIIIVRVFNDHHFDHAALEMYSSNIHENQCNQCKLFFMYGSLESKRGQRSQ